MPVQKLDSGFLLKSEQDVASLCPCSQATGDFCEEGWSLETWKLCLTLRQSGGALSWVTAAGSQDPSEKPEVVAWASGQQRIWKDCHIGVQAPLLKQEENPAPW